MHNVAAKGKISKSIYADLNNKQNSAFNIKMLFNGFMSSAYASQSNSSTQDLLKQIKILTKRVSDIEALLDEKPEVEFAIEHPIVGDTLLLIKANKICNNNSEIMLNN